MGMHETTIRALFLLAGIAAAAGTEELAADEQVLGGSGVD